MKDSMLEQIEYAVERVFMIVIYTMPILFIFLAIVTLLVGCSQNQPPQVIQQTIIQQVDGVAVAEIIDPCGDAPGTYDEVLLRLSNGQILAHYANGANQFFTLLTPGSYVTTDGTNCYFTVTADGKVL